MYTNTRLKPSYRQRWQFDKIVRNPASTARAPVAGKIYVKSGLVTWETQQTDYPHYAS